MPSLSFKSSVSVTHITTATTILSIDDKGDFEQQGGFVLTKTDDPALGLEDLPVIHAARFHHAKNLAPRPGVRGLAPWESVTLTLNGKQFKITGTPTQHLPGGECTGFVLESPSFGVNEADGLPNVVYVSGDTVHIPELATELPKKYHVVVAFMNLGKAIAPLPTGPVQITMGGVQAAQLTRDIGAEKMVPLHFESWKHFTESGDDVRAELAADAAVKDKVVWVVPGEKTTVV
ncbi:Metallo-beta-lactamase [Phytophthora cactorum]|nr:Metallo-beta-lactamase [Phytophthora cactorum]